MSIFCTDRKIEDLSKQLKKEIYLPSFLLIKELFEKGNLKETFLRLNSVNTL